MADPATTSGIISDEQIKTIVRRIVSHFSPRRIILFGSYARVSAGSDSDLDLFIEMESNLSPPERAAEVAALIGLRPWSLDIIVYTPEEAANLRGVRGTLLSRIEREGPCRTVDPPHWPWGWRVCGFVRIRVNAEICPQSPVRTNADGERRAIVSRWPIACIAARASTRSFSSRSKT